MFKLKITKKKFNTKNWDKMERRLLRSQNNVVRVGWWQSRHPSGVSVAQVAQWNEEGHLNGGMFAGTYTPPRPFIRVGWLPIVKKDVRASISDIHLIALGKLTWSKFYKSSAERYHKLMLETILAWDSPPNSPVTVSIKGFNDPLIDTGKMYDSVKYKIIKFSASYN